MYANLRTMKNLKLFIIIIFTSFSTFAQNEEQLEKLSFLTGYWVGDGFGGISEEFWTPANNGVITGLYRHFGDNQLTFSEFIQISTINDTLALRLKHFHPNLIGWESKEDYITFNLKSIETNKAVFGGLTYELIDPKHLKIELKLKRKDGTTYVETFNMTKQEL